MHAVPRITAIAIALLAAVSARPESESQHVPPGPPTKAMPDMPYREMVKMMGMDDTAPIGMVLLDRLEWRGGAGADAGAWDGYAWYGGDYNKLWCKTEGERTRGRTEDARAELLWDRIVTRWWSLQLGARQDFGAGPPRRWAAIGVQGLAPQWFDIEATIYAGDGGRTAARPRFRSIRYGARSAPALRDSARVRSLHRRDLESRIRRDCRLQTYGRRGYRRCTRGRGRARLVLTTRHGLPTTTWHG